MTRQNVTDGPREVMTRRCPTCDGDGIVVSEGTTAVEIERRLRGLVTPGSRAKAFKVELNAKIAALLVGPDASRLHELEEVTKRRFFFVRVEDVHLDHFRVLGQGSVENQAPAAPVAVGEEIELKLGEVGLHDPRAGVGKVKGFEVVVADAGRAGRQEGQGAGRGGDGGGRLRRPRPGRDERGRPDHRRGGGRAADARAPSGPEDGSRGDRGPGRCSRRPRGGRGWRRRGGGSGGSADDEAQPAAARPGAAAQGRRAQAGGDDGCRRRGRGRERRRRRRRARGSRGRGRRGRAAGAEEANAPRHPWRPEPQAQADGGGRGERGPRGRG